MGTDRVEIIAGLKILLEFERYLPFSIKYELKKEPEKMKIKFKKIIFN